jgi:hypothetical protein
VSGASSTMQEWPEESTPVISLRNANSLPVGLGFLGCLVLGRRAVDSDHGTAWLAYPTRLSPHLR